MLTRGLRRAATWAVPEANPAGAIYGVIVVGALLAAESGSHDGYADTLASALIATLLYWFAHAYATLLGRRLSLQERLTVGGLWAALVRDWALVRGAAIPLLALLLAWLGGASQHVAVTAALWTSVTWLVALELAAGVRARASVGELALEAGIGAAMGLAIVAMKILLRH